jgi:hypothetical protein
MTEIRVRSLDPDIARELEAAAKSTGRSLESHVREILKEAARAGVGDFPGAADWDRAGFDEVHELIPGRQYLAWAAMTPYRITIMRAVTGEQPEWNTLIEEAVGIDDPDGERVSVWSRAVDVAQRLLGTSPGMALRDAIRWLAEYAGVDTISLTRETASRMDRLSPNFRQIVEKLDAVLLGEKRFPRDNMVIWNTSRFDVYINKVDDLRGALMVYRHREDWSVSDGKPTYFQLGKGGYETIRADLARLGVLA